MIRNIAKVAHAAVILFRKKNLQILKAEEPLVFSWIYVCMSENFKVSFQKVAKPWIHKGVSLIKVLLFKDPKTRENHHRPRSVVVIPYHPFLKMSLFFYG